MSGTSCILHSSVLSSSILRSFFFRSSVLRFFFFRSSSVLEERPARTFFQDAKFNPKFRACPEFSERYSNPSLEQRGQTFFYLRAVFNKRIFTKTIRPSVTILEYISKILFASQGIIFLAYVFVTLKYFATAFVRKNSNNADLIGSPD